MKLSRYVKEIVVLLVQLIMFYMFPLSAGPADVMGMVVIIIISVFILSIVIGSISNSKLKYFYPVIISILFILSIFIYYNDSALVHALWYLIISYIGLGIGLIIYKLKK